METLGWETVTGALAQRLPFVLPLGGEKGAQLVSDGQQGQMCVRLPCGESDGVPKIALAHLQIAKQVALGKTWLAIEALGLNDLQPFHQLAVLCATMFEVRGVGAADAVARGLQSWSQLLEKRALLSAEAQLGLRGELSLLVALIGLHGPQAVEAWTAYNVAMPGRHDFRIKGVELEVKSTRQRARRHWISSISQLEHSPGFRLFLLSLQFEQAGTSGGLSLRRCVGKVREMLNGHPAELARFDGQLALAQYRDQDASFYDEPLVLASQPKLIPVDESIPRLTSRELQRSFIPSALQRLIEVRYEIDCEGLGASTSSPNFTALLGTAPLE